MRRPGEARQVYTREKYTPRKVFKMNVLPKCMTVDASPSPVLTRYEAAELGRISVGSLDELIRRKQIPTVRLGRRVLIPRASFERILSGEARGDRAS